MNRLLGWSALFLSISITSHAKIDARSCNDKVETPVSPVLVEDVTPKSRPLQLDPTRRSKAMEDILEKLKGKVVGQDPAVYALAEILQITSAGLNSPGRPLGNLLFLGPTGTGKTRVVEALSEIVLGNAKAMLKLDCAEFQHSHEIAKLIGSPPGYLGHKETHPAITQEVLAAQEKASPYNISIVLFDEIEKASDALWQLLLGMLDKATLTLGDNRKVDFSRTIIVLTSNIGASSIAEILSTKGSSMGFANGAGLIAPKQGKIENVGVEAARRKFSPEFMNRLDKVITFQPLTREKLDEVLTLELNQLQARIHSTSFPFFVRVTPSARKLLLDKGTDLRYGARELKRTIERYVVNPFANLLATQQIQIGEVVEVDWDGLHDHMNFYSEPGQAIVRSDKR